jgi:hypothetical protein
VTGPVYRADAHKLILLRLRARRKAARRAALSGIRGLDLIHQRSRRSLSPRIVRMMPENKA